MTSMDDPYAITRLDFSMCLVDGAITLLGDECLDFSYKFPMDEMKGKPPWELPDFYRKYSSDAISLVEDKISQHQDIIRQGLVKEIEIGTNVGGDWIGQTGAETINSELQKHFSKTDKQPGRPMLLFAHDWGVLTFDESEKRIKGM